MSRPRQGDVWWGDLPPPAGRRPVLILTRSPAIPLLGNITVAPLTRTRRGIPAEVDLGKPDGLPTECAVTLENILTIPKSLLDRRIAVLNEARMRAVFRAIRYVFAMD